MPVKSQDLTLYMFCPANVPWQWLIPGDHLSSDQKKLSLALALATFGLCLRQLGRGFLRGLRQANVGSLENFGERLAISVVGRRANALPDALPGLKPNHDGTLPLGTPRH